MAEVFVAKRLGPHGFAKRVALKRILPQFAVDPEFVGMFINEATLAARLDHANIVQVFDFGQHGESFFIAMELVDGSNVNQLLRGVSARGEAVPLEAALHIVSETAAALAYAHNQRDDNGVPLGIVHRDVSPANLLITRDGHVKLSDFGIARAANYEARTQTGQLRGKLGYMSPEQVLGASLDGRSDVFTLSTILAEMLIAEPLFGKGNDLDVLMRIRDVDLSTLDGTRFRVPQDVRALLREGLAQHAATRPDAAMFFSMVQEVMRRRGIADGSMQVARLLARLEVVRPRPGDSIAVEAGARPTNLIEVGEVAPPIEDEESGTGSTAVYRARTTRGLLGPLSYAKLVEAILAGDVDADTMVSRAGATFLRAADHTELSRFVDSSALQWRERDLAAPTWHGGLPGATLLPVVHRLTRTRETGALYLRDDARRKKLYFVDGRPDFIASTDRNELLGEYLVKQGACLRMEVDMALAVLSRYDGRLGDALVGLGVLRPVELVRAIKGQVRSRFLEAFRWRTGEWMYVRGARCDEETFAVNQDSCELMRDAACEAHPQELEAALESVRECVLRPASTPPMPLDAYRLPEVWRSLILGINGRSTLGAVVARESAAGGPDVEEVYRALYLGLSCELLAA